MAKVREITDLNSEEYKILRSKVYMDIEDFVKQGHLDEVNELLNAKGLNMEVVKNKDGKHKIYGISKI